MQEDIGINFHPISNLGCKQIVQVDLPDFIAKEGLPVIIMYIAHLIMGFVGVAL